MSSLICAWTNGWTNNRDAGDLMRYRAHNNVTVSGCVYMLVISIIISTSTRPDKTHKKANHVNNSSDVLFTNIYDSNCIVKGIIRSMGNLCQNHAYSCTISELCESKVVLGQLASCTHAMVHTVAFCYHVQYSICSIDIPLITLMS